MPFYRKKPVVISAVLWDGCGAPLPSMPDWFETAIKEGSIVPNEQDISKLLIRTLDGTMTADSGDWIIRGVKGEIYPCKPDIFAATYEPVDGPGPDPYRR